jgi:hypothetical protein
VIPAEAVEAAAKQCKDIDDAALVRFVADKQRELGTWVCVWDLEPPYSELPDRLFRAKMGKLIKKGYLTGCNCGCRGDYELTTKGREYLEWDAALERLASGNH